MQQTKPTPPPTKSPLDHLLEQPLLAVILLMVFAILLLVVCALAYLLMGGSSVGAVLPTPTRNVGFATPTSQSGSVTPPVSGSASIALLPVQGSSGTLITITGRGWSPGDTVKVQVDDPTETQGLVPLVTNAPVADNGTFIASFLLPVNTGWANLTTVQITAESTTTATRTSAEFSIVDSGGPTPTVTPTPAPPSPGDNDDDAIVVTPTTIIIPSIGDWQAEYYSNTTLTGAPTVVRNEAGVDFTWGSDGPSPDLPAAGFSARWLRTYELEAGLYIFNLRADDGVRLWINDDLIIDEWFASPPRQISADYFIRFNGIHEVRIEYANYTPTGTIRFWLEKVSGVPPPIPGPPYNSWRGAYWPNVNLFGEPLLVRNDPSVNFNWGSGAPAPGLPNNNFSARWDRIIDFAPDSYRFTLVVDDGARLWIDDALIIDEWRDGNQREVSRDYALSGGPHTIRVEYYDRTGDAMIEFRWSKSPSTTPTATATTTATTSPSFPDWKGDYWSNADLIGDVALTRNDPVINFNWGFSSPDSALPADNFSTRWSRTVNFSPGLYRFTAEFDDGLRFYVDGSLVLNEWSDATSLRNRTIDLSLNGSRQLVVEYYERTGSAQVRFNWELIPPTATATNTATPTGTITGTPTGTPTTTATSIAPSTPTGTTTATPTLTVTHTPTSTATHTPTATLVATSTVTVTVTITP
ncbi:MAG: hypothetical protein KDJ65_24020 [Anaerolineae bacterium]|nr:hypothetical protein [Anaerolineae bacterium]